MKNIRIILLGQLLLVILVFVFCVCLASDAGMSAVTWFIDFPSLITILIFLILGLLIMGAWKDFIKSFSVGIKKYNLLELKNIISAVGAAQKLTVYGALFSVIVSIVLVLGNLADFSHMGVNLAVALMTGLYAVIIEFFLLPLKLNAEKKMNEEMDLDDE